MQSVIARLIARLKACDMSQADLARAVGETPQTVQNWKKRGAIPANKLPAVARVLNTSADWLLGGGSDYSIKEESANYNSVPAQLVEAWQHLDESARATVLTLVQQLAKSRSRK